MPLSSRCCSSSCRCYQRSAARQSRSARSCCCSATSSSSWRWSSGGGSTRHRTSSIGRRRQRTSSSSGRSSTSCGSQSSLAQFWRRHMERPLRLARRPRCEAWHKNDTYTPCHMNESTAAAPWRHDLCDVCFRLPAAFISMMYPSPFVYAFSKLPWPPLSGLLFISGSSLPADSALRPLSCQRQQLGVFNIPCCPASPVHSCLPLSHSPGVGNQPGSRIRGSSLASQPQIRN